MCVARRLIADASATVSMLDASTLVRRIRLAYSHPSSVLASALDVRRIRWGLGLRVEGLGLTSFSSLWCLALRFSQISFSHTFDRR